MVRDEIRQLRRAAHFFSPPTLLPSLPASPTPSLSPTQAHKHAHKKATSARCVCVCARARVYTVRAHRRVCVYVCVCVCVCVCRVRAHTQGSYQYSKYAIQAAIARLQSCDHKGISTVSLFESVLRLRKCSERGRDCERYWSNIGAILERYWSDIGARAKRWGGEEVGTPRASSDFGLPCTRMLYKQQNPPNSRICTTPPRFPPSTVLSLEVMTS